MWAVWRAELFTRAWTRRLGTQALRVFGAGFFVLFALRLVACLVAAPAVWALHSVARWFGIRRALGVDHFEPGFDEPLVRRGAFARVPHAMYTLAFLLLWAIAIAAGSRAALVAAGTQRALVWVHYLATERPDMQVTYGGRRRAGIDP